MDLELTSPMNTISRRSFLQDAVLPPAALSLSACLPMPQAAASEDPPSSPTRIPEIIDTNVHVLGWPFRRLKYAGTKALVEKLRTCRVRQAWAGSFEALLHKDLDGVNERLAEECREKGEGFLLPFGSVNPVWPDWEEDLRRCQDAYGMPGIRLYPSYHHYTLEHPEFARLLHLASTRRMLVQIALEMEDERVHHPIIDAPPADAAPLTDLLKKVPKARVQLINSSNALQGVRARALVGETGVDFDISHIEGTGAIGRFIGGVKWDLPVQVPVERLLFGSHAPFFPPENAVLKLFESPLSLDQLRAIMRGNARRLLDRA